MGRIAKRVVVASIFSLVAGCSLFVSLDGLEGASSGGTDGATDAPDGATNDAPGSDAAAIDASLDSGAPSPCGVPHAFCDDFDQPGETPDSSTIWTGLSNTAPPGWVAINGAFVQSPPHALEAYYPPDGGQYNYEGLYKNFSGPFSSAHFEFDMRVEALDTTSDQVLFFDMEGQTPTASFDMQWHFAYATQYIYAAIFPDDSGPSTDHSGSSTPALALHTWYHVVIDFENPDDAGAPTWTIAVGGLPTLTSTFPVPFGATTDLGFAIGALSVSTKVAANDVVFDNVFCDYH